MKDTQKRGKKRREGSTGPEGETARRSVGWAARSCRENPQEIAGDGGRGPGDEGFL